MDDGQPVKKRKSRKRKAQAIISEGERHSAKRQGPLRNKQVNYAESTEEFYTDDDVNHDNSTKTTKRARNNQHSDFHVNLASSRNSEDTQRLKICDKLLGELMKNEKSWPFLKPVSKRDVGLMVFFHFC